MEAMPLMPAAPAATAPTSASWRAHDLGTLLFGAAGRCVRTKIKAVHAGGFPTISEAQLTLFHHLEPGGMRLTALAAQAGLTKQGMIELVDRASAMGLVGRRPDPGDRRAKIVHPTPAAATLLSCLHQGVVRAERDVQDAFGAPFLVEVRARLDAYAGREVPAFVGLPDGEAWRLHNIGRLFAMSARRFSREALRVAQQAGWTSVNEVSLALFRNLPVEGSRLTDVAAAARVTKQSMRELVDRAETSGLVRRRSDPADRRAKTIGFTPEGRRLLEAVRDGLAVAEQRFRRETGEGFAAALSERLHEFTSAARRLPAF